MLVFISRNFISLQTSTPFFQDTEEVKIPLGDGRTLMLPVDVGSEEGGSSLNDLDLDQDAREKILKIKAMLDKVQF